MPSIIEILAISPLPALAETLRQLPWEGNVRITTAPQWDSALVKTNISQMIIYDIAGQGARHLPDTGGKPLVVLASSAAQETTPPYTIWLEKPLSLQALGNILRQVMEQFHDGKPSILLGDFTLYPTIKTLEYRGGGNMLEIRLTEKEVALLQVLYQSQEKAVSRDALLVSAWGYQDGIDTHTLETHIYRLRQKVKEICPEKELIVTEAEGYRLELQ